MFSVNVGFLLDMEEHRIFDERTLRLQRLWKCPSQSVGELSVIVSKSKIMGEGWHHRAGEPHAEINVDANFCKG